eukprot:scaffold613134_cov63-Attheya_sp.AAC.1
MPTFSTSSSVSKSRGQDARSVTGIIINRGKSSAHDNNVVGPLFSTKASRRSKASSSKSSKEPEKSQLGFGENQTPPHDQPNSVPFIRTSDRITVTDDIDQQHEGFKRHNNALSGAVSGLLSHIIPGRRDQLVSATPEWKRLQKHAEYIKGTHLRNLLKEEERCDTMFASHDGIYCDYSRQRATLETLDLLLELADARDLKGKMNAMFEGEKINFTEDRAVLHTALRADRSKVGTVHVDGVDAIQEVHEVLDQVKYFTDA